MANMPFIVAIFGILMPIAIVGIIFWYQNRSEQRFHDSIDKAIEAGQVIDEDLLRGMPGYVKKNKGDDFRNGVMTTATGFGLILLGFFALGKVLVGVGALVLCIGLGILALSRFADGSGDKANKALPDLREQ